MAEPITLQTLLTYLTLISVPVGVFYHIMTLRNTRKNQELQLETRQAQLFMGLYETYKSPEFRKRHSEIINQEWETYDDFMEKYGSETNPDAWTRWMSTGAFYNGIGILLKQGLIGIALVEELLSNAVFISWVRMGPIVKDWRERDRRFEGGRSSKYNFFHGFEYLYNELKKWEQEHPELTV